MFEERITSNGRLSLFLLLFFLSVQFTILSDGPWLHPSGDERYYAAKADQLLKKGEIPKAEGSGDWRPVGYSVFLAFFLSITENWVVTRMMCAFIHFILLSLILITFQTISYQ